MAPGAVHVPDWLSLEQQRQLVDACRGWATGPVPIRAARLPGGHVMSVRIVCLGWHWQPYRYSRTADDIGRDYRPDTALINYYDATARMGMHPDKDEETDEPVVSLSIGDCCLHQSGTSACPRLAGPGRYGALRFSV